MSLLAARTSQREIKSFIWVVDRNMRYVGGLEVQKQQMAGAAIGFALDV
jgi:hypothetical protein